jgi:hypothetical protein
MEKQPVKGFYQLSKAWYGEVNLKHSKYDDEIMIGLYHEEGGTSGEFSMKWFELSGRSVPKLGAFSDSWKILSEMPELISKLSELDSLNPSPDDFADMLRGLGFKDLTQYEDEGRGKVNPLVKEVHEAYRFLRENNHSISDEVIDLMKKSALEALK